MGFLDRWKRSAPGSDEQARVPDGHELVMYRPRSQPYLELSRGGVLIANLGSSSDDSMRETLDLLTRVEESLDTASHDALLTQAGGRVSDLFAPADPLVESCSNPLLWLIADGSGNEWTGEPERLQQILRRWYELSVRKGQPITQMAFVPPPRDPGRV